jgi:hypothetical protein
MLLVPEEREAIIRNNIGIVFLTSGQEFIARVLQLLLAKWETLERLNNTAQKPFARFLSLNGRTRNSYHGVSL